MRLIAQNWNGIIPGQIVLVDVVEPTFAKSTAGDLNRTESAAQSQTPMRYLGLNEGNPVVTPLSGGNLMTCHDHTRLHQMVYPKITTAHVDCLSSVGISATRPGFGGHNERLWGIVQDLVRCGYYTEDASDPSVAHFSCTPLGKLTLDFLQVDAERLATVRKQLDTIADQAVAAARPAPKRARRSTAATKAG